MAAKLYKFVADSEKPFVCLKCKRGFSSEGGFNLHGPCGPGYKKGKGQERNTERKNGGCGECGGKMRLLREEISLEARAIKAGHSCVCTVCGEVI